MTGSRIQGFHRLPIAERRRRLGDTLGLSAADVQALAGDGFPPELGDSMIENAVGTFTLPLGVALNFRINGRDVVVPMVVEEPSVIAAASGAALLARVGGGFKADADPGAHDRTDPARRRPRRARGGGARVAARATTSWRRRGR